MVMNHYKKPKSFYVRTKVWYTTEKRKSIWPIVIGNCAQLGNGMSYDVPGGGRKGSNYVNSSDWVAPFSGRLLVASSHQHGGGKYQTLDSRTCKRRLFKAPVYHGLPNHPYNAIRPILHEPGPIGTGAYATAKGIPVPRARCCAHRGPRRPQPARRLDGLLGHLVRPGRLGQALRKMPGDVVEINKPKRYDHTPDYDLVVPQLSKPRGVFSAFDGSPCRGGRRVLPARQDHGQGGPAGHVEVRRLTAAQRDRRQRPARLLIGLLGTDEGQLHRDAEGKGTYKLVCLVHPTTMAETLVVK